MKEQLVIDVTITGNSKIPTNFRIRFVLLSMSSFFFGTPASSTAETHHDDATNSSPSGLKSLYKSAKRAAGIPSKKHGLKDDHHEENVTAFDTKDMDDALPNDDANHDANADGDIDVDVDGTVDASPGAFTDAEIKAARDTKALLLSDKYGMKPEEVTGRELMITVMTCKCRIDQAAEKYKKWTDVCREGVGLATIRSAFEGVGSDAERLRGSDLEAISTRVFWCAGRDTSDRSVMWIHTEKTPVEMERSVVRAGIIYFTAIHSDLVSLRRGVTFVLDTFDNDMQKSYGNESKMQKIWQTLPLRPQRIFIVGANMVKRVVINALLVIGQLFTKGSGYIHTPLHMSTYAHVNTSQLLTTPLKCPFVFLHTTLTTQLTPPALAPPQRRSSSGSGSRTWTRSRARWTQTTCQWATGVATAGWRWRAGAWWTGSAGASPPSPHCRTTCDLGPMTGDLFTGCLQAPSS